MTKRDRVAIEALAVGIRDHHAGDWLRFPSDVSNVCNIPSTSGHFMPGHIIVNLLEKRYGRWLEMIVRSFGTHARHHNNYHTTAICASQQIETGKKKTMHLQHPDDESKVRKDFQSHQESRHR